MFDKFCQWTCVLKKLLVKSPCERGEATRRQEEEKEKHDGTAQPAVQTCARFCMGLGGK